MLQVAVWGPFHKLELPDQHRLEPAAFLHPVVAYADETLRVLAQEKAWVV